MELLLLKSTEVVESMRPPQGKIPWKCTEINILKLLAHKTGFLFWNTVYSMEIYRYVYRYLEILNFYFILFSIRFGIRKNINLT